MPLIKAKAGKITIGDALAVAGLKIAEERLLSGFIGNGRNCANG